MRQLITRIREGFPFDVPAAQICDGECRGCSIKLLDYLAGELDDCEQRIAAGERFGLAELSRLLRSARKIANALRRSGLPVAMETAPETGSGEHISA